MKSFILLGLSGLAANVQAHPQKRGDISRRGVDIEKYRPTGKTEYTSSQDAVASPNVAAIGKRATYTETATELVKSSFKNSEFRMTDDHYTDVNGISHVYFKQTAHGIDIDNTNFNVNIDRNGKVFSFGNSFFKGAIPAENPTHKRAFSNPLDALKGAVSTLGLSVDTKTAKAQAIAAAPGSPEHYKFTGTKGAVSDPKAKLVYIQKDDKLALVWRVETDVMDNWLLTYVDAASPNKILSVADYVNDADATYQVYPFNVNDPTEGDRVVISNPWTGSSPFTWIGDGSTNYTTTRGNNGIAQVNPGGGDDYINNYRPNSPELKFEYPYSPSQANHEEYKDASITQLFFTANKYHDLLYTLGFNEPAGNFQTNNNGKGGKGDDGVILNAQDGSGTNNANFATPPDGQPGRMRMFMWTRSTPQRDCSFDANVVLHEYTHGLSNRLTGGPSNTNCLLLPESGGMGEGWSDIMAVATRIKTTDTHNTDYTIGEWIANKKGGIRAYPYSTSMKTNPYTYGSVNQQQEVHAIGTVWASVLYEALWNLIDAYGITASEVPEFDSKGVPKDGRYLFMKLVMGGMSLQPCNPDMVSARNAILDADKALTGGKNQCALWKAFAKRGLGKDAIFLVVVRVENFDIPAGVC